MTHPSIATLSSSRRTRQPLHRRVRRRGPVRLKELEGDSVVVARVEALRPLDGALHVAGAQEHAHPAGGGGLCVMVGSAGRTKGHLISLSSSRDIPQRGVVQREQMQAAQRRPSQKRALFISERRSMPAHTVPALRPYTHPYLVQPQQLDGPRRKWCG